MTDVYLLLCAHGGTRPEAVLLQAGSASGRKVGTANSNAGSCF